MEKEEAIYILSDIRSEYNCFSNIEGGRYHALCMGIEALKEQKHGEWVLLWHDFFRSEVHMCSCCKGISAFKTIYCANCGARMDGDK